MNNFTRIKYPEKPDIGTHRRVQLELGMRRAQQLRRIGGRRRTLKGDVYFRALVIPLFRTNTESPLSDNYERTHFTKAPTQLRTVVFFLVIRPRQASSVSVVVRCLCKSLYVICTIVYGVVHAALRVDRSSAECSILHRFCARILLRREDWVPKEPKA